MRSFWGKILVLEWYNRHISLTKCEPEIDLKVGQKVIGDFRWLFVCMSYSFWFLMLTFLHLSIRYLQFPRLQADWRGEFRQGMGCIWSASLHVWLRQIYSFFYMHIYVGIWWFTVQFLYYWCHLLPPECVPLCTRVLGTDNKFIMIFVYGLIVQLDYMMTVMLPGSGHSIYFYALLWPY